MSHYCCNIYLEERRQHQEFRTGSARKEDELQPGQGPGTGTSKVQRVKANERVAIEGAWARVARISSALGILERPAEDEP